MNKNSNRRADTEYGKGVQYGFGIGPWWNNLSDRIAYNRMFAEGEPTRMRIAQAMLSQDPLTSRGEIRDNMTVKRTPPKTGYTTKELTITQVLNHDFELAGTHVDTSLWNEFSDSNGETNATSRPGVYW